MAWSAPMTAVAGAVFTAAQFNAFIRDNLSETAPAKATTPSGYFVTSDTNQIAERVGVANHNNTADTTTSTSYGNLNATTGPSVTVTTGRSALVIVSCSLSNNSTSSSCMAYEISGATTLAAEDARGVTTFGAVNVGGRAGNAVLETVLTPGVNTFTARYRVTGGTGTFGSRRIQVLPF